MSLVRGYAVSVVLGWEVAASKKQCLLGVQGEDPWAELFEMFPFFFVFIAAMQIVISSEPALMP
jgi:hypothetical protein